MESEQYGRKKGMDWRLLIMWFWSILLSVSGEDKTFHRLELEIEIKTQEVISFKIISYTPT